jgi:hypothetical protein
VRAARWSSARGQRGSVTAETAVLLPAVVLVAALCLWAVAAVAVQVRCLAAARSGARALARGEPVATVVASTLRAAPSGAEVRTNDAGPGLVAVEVRSHVALPGPWPGSGPGVTVEARVVAAAEGTEPPGGGAR